MNFSEIYRVAVTGTDLGAISNEFGGMINSVAFCTALRRKLISTETNALRRSALFSFRRVLRAVT